MTSKETPAPRSAPDRDASAGPAGPAETQEAPAVETAGQFSGAGRVGPPPGPGQLAHLQRTLGNRAVAQMLSPQPGAPPIQRVSADDAQARLQVRADDAAMASSVETIQIFGDIVEEVPKLESAIADYNPFIEAHAGRKHPALNKKDLARHVGGLVKFMTNKLSVFIGVIEEIEDWYINAGPVDRKKAADDNLAWWRDNRAAFRAAPAPVAKLFAVTAEPITDTDSRLTAAIGHLGLIKGIVQGLISGGGGGFSAKGRASAIEAEVVDKGTGGTATLTIDNTFLDSITIGDQRLDKQKEVRKAHPAISNNGPLVLKGVRIDTGQTYDKAALISNVESGMSPAETTQQQTFKTIPSARDRGKGQYTNMNNTNARSYAWLIDMDGWDSSQWEWLHIRAASLGGATDSTNLILGTRDANTQMMPFEANVRTLASIARQEDAFQELEVTWKAYYSHSSAKHAYEYISITWALKPNPDAMDGTVPDAIAKAKGTVIFDVLQTNSVLSKSEVEYLETVLKEVRDALQPE